MMDYRLFKNLFGIDTYKSVRVNILDKSKQKEINDIENEISKNTRILICMNKSSI